MISARSPASSAGELQARLGLDGVLVHEHLAGRNHTLGPARCREAAAGAADRGRAQRRGPARRLRLRRGGGAAVGDRVRAGAAVTDEELSYLAMACETALVAAAQAARVNEERTAARTGRALVELGQALALEHGEDRCCTC